MQRFVIIDGNAIVHRAYHALPPLTSKSGELVNAVYGFTAMLLRIINDLKPTYIAVAFDRPEPTFRKEILPSYQAQRPEMDNELVQQFLLVKTLVQTMKIPIFEVAGYEADDVIGTIAKNIVSRWEVRVVIVTGDRDMLQLVDDNIKVYMPIKGLSEAKLFDRAAVKEKYGIEAEQIVDYKALVGDASDNYPGVTGVGPKTAADLLQRYQSLEAIYRHLGEEKNKKLVEKLTAGEKAAEMAKKLAEIVCDVPLQVDLENCRFKDLNREEAVEALSELGFKSLLNRIAKVKSKKKNENQLGLNF